MLLQIVQYSLTSTSAQITPRPNEYPDAALGEIEQLWKRGTNVCDDQGIFHCPTGTCYEYHGSIGCCSVSSCAPRTTCIEHIETLITEPCDRNTGGCLYCNNPAAPHCRTQTNPLNSQYNHYCDTIGGTITVTTGTFAKPTTVATSTSISTKTMAAMETASAAASPGHSLSYGAIVGTACGVSAAVLLVAAALWYIRSRKRGQHEEEQEKHRGATDEIPASESRDGNEQAPNKDQATRQAAAIMAPTSCGDHDTAKQSTDNLGSPTSTLAYMPKDGTRYTVTNPDLNPISPTDSSIRDFKPSHTSAVEAPSDRPVMAKRPFIPVSESNITAPSRTNSASQFPSPIAAHTPYTPSQYHPSAPNSIAKPFLQPPSLPQDYSTATFASDATRVPAGLYTPSNYQPGAPGSVARTAPPNLPQEYSAATLPSDNPDGSPIYRGLRSSSSSAFPPYAYLSPEDALAGGWTNDSPPHGEH